MIEKGWEEKSIRGDVIFVNFFSSFRFYSSPINVTNEYLPCFWIIFFFFSFFRGSYFLVLSYHYFVLLLLSRVPLLVALETKPERFYHSISQ